MIHQTTTLFKVCAARRVIRSVAEPSIEADVDETGVIGGQV